MNFISKKITFGLIVGNRGFFNAALATGTRSEVIGILESLGFDSIVLPADASGAGIIGTREDAAKCSRLFKEQSDKIDGIIVILPNFGDEIAVVEAIRGANLAVPVLVQASNDEVSKVDIKSRRDAFCGKISLCNNLYQYDIPFTDTTEHTCDVSGESFKNDIKRFAALCRVVKGLKNLRVGLIGTRPASFQTVRFSEKILQKNGITTIPVDLSEILALANSLDGNATEVKQKIQAMKNYGKIPSSIPEKNVLRQACFSVAVEKWCELNQVNAAAIQCWNSIEEIYGCAACVTMSMMGEAKKPCACEADICGAISMYELLLASGNASALLDWNNNYAYEKDLCVNTHCSNYPKSFMGTDVEISNLDLLGDTLGANRCFGAVKGNVVPGDMSFFRISTDDTRGIIKAYVGEGEFVQKHFPMDGGIAICHVEKMRKLLKVICSNGFEHHVAMVRSHVAGIVYEAVKKYLKWNVYYHNIPEVEEDTSI